MYKRLNWSGARVSVEVRINSEKVPLANKKNHPSQAVQAVAVNSLFYMRHYLSVIVFSQLRSQ